MDLDTLYYYNLHSMEDIGKPKKGIKMNDCLEIFEKDMSKSKETGFSFSINMGDRLYHLMCESETDRKKWMQALNISMNTIKELG